MKQKETFTDFASTSGEVSAFARAVIGNVIPRDFWGKGDGGEANREVIMGNVDRFVKLRRYESFSLHEVMQGLKVTSISSIGQSRAMVKRLTISTNDISSPNSIGSAHSVPHHPQISPLQTPLSAVNSSQSSCTGYLTPSLSHSCRPTSTSPNLTYTGTASSIFAMMYGGSLASLH